MSALSPCETSYKSPKPLSSPSFDILPHNSMYESKFQSAGLKGRAAELGSQVLNLVQRGYSPLCASLGYSECAFLTGYMGGLGVHMKYRYLVWKKGRDKYPSFYSIPLFSTDSLGLVQLQTLSEDFSALVSISNKSSGLIVMALNDIFLLSLSFRKYTKIYKI